MKFTANSNRCLAIYICMWLMRMRCMRGRRVRELLLSTRRRTSLTGTAAPSRMHSEYLVHDVAAAEDLNTKNTEDAESAEKKDHGALGAMTPMLAMLSPFFMEGTAQMWRMMPETGARASKMTLPKKSVTSPSFLPAST